MATKLTSLETVLTMAVGSVLTLGGVATYNYTAQDSGEQVVVQNATPYYSGALLPVDGTITLTEVGGVASGTYALQNPYDKTLLCDLPTIDITTAADSSTIVDISVQTGSLAQAGSGVNLADNFDLSRTGTITLTGGTLASAGEKFKLFPYNTTASNTHIVFTSRNQTGANLAAQVHTACYAID